MPMARIAGGEIVLLGFRIAITLKPRDSMFFDSQWLHRNLSFEGERLSAACFSASRIGDYDDQRLRLEVERPMVYRDLNSLHPVK